MQPSFIYSRYSCYFPISKLSQGLTWCNSAEDQTKLNLKSYSKIKILRLNTQPQDNYNE